MSIAGSVVNRMTKNKSGVLALRVKHVTGAFLVFEMRSDALYYLGEGRSISFYYQWLSNQIRVMLRFSLQYCAIT